MNSLAANDSSLLSLLVSPSGSINRSGFVLGAALLGAASLTFDGIARIAPNPWGLTQFAFALAIMWSAGCLSRKRLHDLSQSGWLIVLFLAAYACLAVTVPMVAERTASGLFRHGWLLPAAFFMPLAAWCSWLAVIPGRSARERTATDTMQVAPATAPASVLRVGRM